MKILICPDKFKGSLSAKEVCEAIGNGLLKSGSSATMLYHPMADGGDGSLEILAGHLELIAQDMITTDPLGREIAVRYFTSSKAAFIEVASASGLVLLSPNERSPMATSTFGSGQMMADAITKGFRRIYLFLGGSATNDAGMGIASALGCEFLDENKHVLKPTGENLSKVQCILPGRALGGIENIAITLLCDVDNPLYGPNGAAQVYARQKGATELQVKQLDDGLQHFSSILQKQLGVDVGQLQGGGAAGGIGAGLVALFGAKIKGGFTAISELTALEKQIESADWVISGEGRLDSQSLQGKVIGGVAELCKKHRKPLALFVGKNDLPQQAIDSLNVRHIFSISEQATSMEDAMQNGAAHLGILAGRFYESLEG